MPLNNGAINEILPFAHGAGANVMTQAEYLADVARTAGNQSGLARSKFVNKLWRQSAHLTAGVAQWIANRYTPGVRDNANLDAVEAGMTAAVQTCASASWPLMIVTWDGAANYNRKTLVIGSNGKIYVWLKASGPGVSGVGAKDPSVAANTAYWLDYAASITRSPYEVGQYYPFQDEMPRPGMVPLLGLIVDNISRYPDMLKYLQSEWGQKRLVTKAEYDARHIAFWHTNADGSRVGWNGEGGVNVFVWDKDADTLLVPDLAGMSWEQKCASLGVGGVHGDAVREIWGGSDSPGTSIKTAGFFTDTAGSVGPTGSGAILLSGGGGAYSIAFGGASRFWNRMLTMHASRVVPVAAKNQPRAWGSLACVYLGLPAS